MNWLHGVNVMGAPVVGDDPMYGPLSPAQLAQVDRKLTPAEQKAVDDFQTKESNDYADKVHAAPSLYGYNTAVSFTPTPQKQMTPVLSPVAARAAAAIKPPAGPEWPAWKIALIAGGSFAAVLAVALAASIHRSPAKAK